MSEESFKKFKKFYDTTVEYATDEDVSYMMDSIKSAALAKKAEANKNLNDHNKKLIKDFFEEFLAGANDDDAIYLIEVIKSASKKLKDDPTSVAKFVIEKKKEYAKKN